MKGLAALDAAGLWACLHDAARGKRHGWAATVAWQMTADSHVRLGWVIPPPWHTVAQVAAAVQNSPALTGRDQLVVIGTGAWGFAARSLRAVLDEPRLLPLDSLDPAAARSVLERLKRSPTAACIAISASRKTTETRLLATTVQRAGRHLSVTWLCEDDHPPDAFSLSPRKIHDQVALFGAPLSTAFLVPAAFAAHPQLERAYGVFAAQYCDIGASLASLAVSAPTDGCPRVVLRLPHDAPSAVQMWVLQLGRQALCGKSPSFEPWVEVERGAPGPADIVADLDVMPDCDALSRLMGTLYAAAVFTACLGLRAGLHAARHENVREYKRRVLDYHAGGQHPAARACGADELIVLAAAWLADRPDLRYLHIVVYDLKRARDIQNLREALTFRTGVPCEVHEGTEWNHHSYQAAYGNPRVAVLIVVVQRTPETRTDLLSQALAENARARYAIALATVQSLYPRSRLIELQDR